MTTPTTPSPASTSRPHPVRIAASIVGGLTALLAGLVGSGLLTAAQGDALTGIITAAVAALGAFGYVISTERKVTPVSDPRDSTGRPLVPADTPETGEPLDS
ncbi:MAG: hypothetical protein GEV28_26055 [Actinophytocola sp.]|uniref:hypothetical protein n=1 Tax=Actinophytocola sp. TaxID=1872138 RepID=UPI001322FD01|nr:hypothetical protein [Actinophytocola sp.]MPZ83667.1 hypothetical protein [Actinophytocola sp.]